MFPSFVIKPTDIDRICKKLYVRGSDYFEITLYNNVDILSNFLNTDVIQIVREYANDIVRVCTYTYDNNNSHGMWHVLTSNVNGHLVNFKFEYYIINNILLCDIILDIITFYGKILCTGHGHPDGMICSRDLQVWYNRLLGPLLEKYFVKGLFKREKLEQYLYSMTSVSYKHSNSTMQTEILRITIIFYNMISKMISKPKPISKYESIQSTIYNLFHL